MTERGNDIVHELGDKLDRIAESLNTLKWMCRFVIAVDIIILLL
jgi:hypothetical protein